MQRFLALQLHGAENPRALLADMRRAVASRKAAVAGDARRGARCFCDSATFAKKRSRIGQPALVVSGDRDTLAFPAAGRFLAERLPNARFALIAGAAHVPFLSHADAFDAALDEFIDG